MQQQKPERKTETETEFARELITSYFKTQPYPFTRHHIDSFDQFMTEDLPNIIQSSNPILILKDLIPGKSQYKYKVEIFVGGLEGKGIYIGSPTVSLQDTEEVRILLPNEARLRNLTYSAMVLADMYVRVTVMIAGEKGVLEPRIFEINLTKTDEADDRIPLFRMPLMLHSRYCVLHNKPAEFLREAGECEYDYGGYFVVDGAEKVLVTRQEQAFNTLYVNLQERDPQLSIYASITCLSPKTRQVKRIVFVMNKATGAIEVILPMVRKPIPVFIVFRALGIQSDRDIIRQIFPDPDSAEAKLLEDDLLSSIAGANPFMDTYSAIQYMKLMTKRSSDAHGLSEARVLDVIHNQLFIHIDDSPGTRAAFLGDCVRKILRVNAKIDSPTNRDDIRNQRCLTSGFLIQMLFQGLYKTWTKVTARAIDEEYNYQTSIYSNENFVNIFLPGNRLRIFKVGFLTEGIMRGFKGKWSAGNEEKPGVLQGLSRLSYHDFLSHCRRLVLEFDTSMKLAGPRRLNPSQYGYFCTSETPTGGSIGITKNLSILTAISTSTSPVGISKWLFDKANVIPCEYITEDILKISVPVYVNGGILGYTMKPVDLTTVLRLFKRTGCLPSSASIGFNIRERQVFLYLDEGRPMRPLIYLEEKRIFPADKLKKLKRWRDLVMGTMPEMASRELSSSGFFDPFAKRELPATLRDYIDYLKPFQGSIEYIDPYEHNLIYIANFPSYINPETSHVEIHPSTILGLMTSMIPFANHNQSPRNQLSCSQSKQGLSIYSTKYMSRFDNQVHVLCYGEAPICRTLYYDFVADGNIGYGHNLILAIGSFTGYNQDDGIVMNQDALQRGLFRNMSFRSYETFEEDDDKLKTRTRIANPEKVPGWTNISAGVNYRKLDDRGIIKKGEYVDQNTVIVGRYVQTESGSMRDASLTPQLWTSGRVDEVVVLVNNMGLRLIKIRVVHDRIPVLGDKFSNRHGQKGTIGMMVRGHDMPRTKDGLVPDMIMNPHAIPSRMTVAQLLETIFGKSAALLGAISNGTSFMNEGNPTELIGSALEKHGLEKYGNELLYDGTTGVQIPSAIFIGTCYTMRLKHMTEDKWNARGAGRREQRTHQPTGGRGNEGGLRIGEMECWALQGHGVSGFFQESLMKRSDGSEFVICNSCGTVPIYNESTKLFVCSLCDGPVRYAGDTVKNLELLPPIHRSSASFSKVEMPYATYLLNQELNTYMNMGMRILTSKDVERLRRPEVKDLLDPSLIDLANKELQVLVLPDTTVPQYITPVETVEARPEDLRSLGLAQAEPEGQTEAVAEAVAEAILNANTNANTNANSIPVNVVLRNTVQQGQPQQNRAFNYTVVGEPEPSSSIDAIELNPFIQEQQQQQQQPSVNINIQSQPQQQQQRAPTNAILVPSAIPGAPPTLVVDTGPEEMQRSGFPPLEQQVPRQRQPTRSPRNVGFAQPANNSPAVAASTVPATTKVNVIKQG